MTVRNSWVTQGKEDVGFTDKAEFERLKRNGENIIPNGNTRLLENDVLVLSATSPDHVEGVSLVEIYVDENSKYNGKLLSEIPKKENTLVIMIQRGEQVIIPHGNIRLESGDMLVVSKTEI